MNKQDGFDEENEEGECRHVWYIDPTDYDSYICSECGERKN